MACSSEAPSLACLFLLTKPQFYLGQQCAQPQILTFIASLAGRRNILPVTYRQKSTRRDCWETTPGGLPFLSIFQAAALAVFCFRLSSQARLKGIQPWKIDILSLQSKRKACLEPAKTETMFHSRTKGRPAYCYYISFGVPKRRVPLL